VKINIDFLLVVVVVVDDVVVVGNTKGAVQKQGSTVCVTDLDKLNMV
jgi:hypothetical protein